MSSILTPAPPPSPVPVPNPSTEPFRLHAGAGLFSWAERIDYLQQFGIHSQHFTALQPGMTYFDVPGVGYLSYALKWGRAVVLGDPVADPCDFPEVLQRFAEVHPKASYVQVTGATAQILQQKFGYYGTQFGLEQKVPLDGWTMSGKSRKCIRKAVNQAKEQGIEIRESDQLIDDDAVSSDWLETRKVRGREIGFMVRARKMDYSDGTRYFYAFKDGQPIGFAYFDPGYQDGNVVSYLPNICACSSFKQGLFYTIMVHAIDVFRKEGVRWIDLGLHPLAVHPLAINGKETACESRIVRSIFRTVYRFGQRYNFQGLHFTKTRFGGDFEPTFYCHRRTLPVGDMGRIVALLGLF